jgi:hypothetical protein
VLLAIGFAMMSMGARRRESGCSGLGRTALFRTDATNESRLAALAFDESEMLDMSNDVHASFATGGFRVARSVDVRLDSSSRMFLLSAGQAPLDRTYAPPWVFSCPPDQAVDGCYARSGIRVREPASFAEVPYDGADDGPARRIQLEYELVRPTVSFVRPWYAPVDDVRLFDSGICDVVIPWQTLAQQVNRAVFAQVLSTVQKQVTLRAESFQFGYAGPVFNRSQGQTVNVGSRPTVDDRFALRLTQVVRATTAAVLQPEIIGSELGLLQASLVRGASGANELRVTGTFSESDPALEYSTRFLVTQNQSTAIADLLGRELAGQLARTLNGQLAQLVEQPSASASIYRCDTATSGEDTKARCLFEMRRTPVGAEVARTLETESFECTPWSALSVEQVLAQPKFRINYCGTRNFPRDEPLERRGFCSVRISPRRVQVAPEGLQLVLLDQASAPNANFIRNSVIGALRRSPDLVARCDTDRRWTGTAPPRTRITVPSALSPERVYQSCTAGLDCTTFIGANTPNPPLPLPECR